MKTTFFAYYGHHKCGTTWISHIVSELCHQLDLRYNLQWNDQLFGKDIDAIRKITPFDFLCYTNADYIQISHLNAKAFHVVRDPRDLIISAYYSHLYSHPDDWPRIRLFRKQLKMLSKEDGLLREIEYSLMNYHHLLTWDYTTSNIKEVKFEDMITHPLETWAAILSHLGLYPETLTHKKLEDIITKYSFKKMSGGRARGENKSTHHFRKGIAGDWRNHFNSRHIKYFKQLYNPILLKLGYETHEDWS